MTNIPKDPRQARATVSVHGLFMIEHASVAHWARNNADHEFHWGRVHEGFSSVADALGYDITRKGGEHV